MKAIIDADAAKLAGLQIDLLQKVRQGHITLDHIEWFAGLSLDARDALMTGGKPASRLAPPLAPTCKFTVLAGLGEFTVPDGYNHATAIAEFLTKDRGKLYGVSGAIHDQNFPNPTRILKPGDKLCVEVHHQIVEGTTTSAERMAYLKQQQGNVFVGAQGIPLIFGERDKLPKGKWYASFDEKDRLWQDADGYHGVPSLDAYSDGGFRFNLGYLEDVWYPSHAFFCFRDQ